MEKNIDFSIILPSRDRPKLLANLVRSLEETTGSPQNIEIVLCLDPDDKESSKLSSTKFRIIKIIDSGDTMGDITRRCFKETSGRYIVLLNDDVIIRTKNWDSIVLEAFLRFPDEIAMVYPNDCYYGKRMCCFPILTRRAAMLMDNIVPPEYGKHSIDSHVFDIFYRLKAKGFDRAVYLRRVVFEHMNLGIISGFDNQGIERDTMLGDQKIYNSFSVYRETVAERLVGAITTSNVRDVDSMSRLVEDKLSLIFILKEWALLTTQSNLELIVNNPRLLQIIDSMAFLGRTSLLKYIKIPSKLKKMSEMIPVLTTEMAVQYINQFAADKSRSRWLAFLDGASEIKEGWPLSPLLYAVSNNNIGIIAPRWLNPRSDNIEQAGLAVFNSQRGMEVSQLYHGCNQGDVNSGEPREVQLAGLSGMILLRKDFVKIGGLKLITQSGFDIAGLCVEIKKLGKKIIYDPNATLYYATENIIHRESLLKWEKELRCDLEETLACDGYLLHRTESSFYIFPSEKLIEDYKKRGNFTGLQRLLNKTLGIAKVFGASKKDIEYLENELSTLNPENSTFTQAYSRSNEVALGIQGDL